MDKNKNNSSKHEQAKTLKNYSQVESSNRLSDEDSETVSELTAGGDKSFLKQDIDDSLINNT